MLVKFFVVVVSDINEFADAECINNGLARDGIIGNYWISLYYA